MITVYHGYHFGKQAKIAIELHVHDATRNVLPRKAMLYAVGLRPPNYPMPALLQDSESNLAKRWSGWYDTDRSFGIRY